MYAVLDKDTIKNEIMPYLSIAKRDYDTKSCLMEEVNLYVPQNKTNTQISGIRVAFLSKLE